MRIGHSHKSHDSSDHTRESVVRCTLFPKITVALKILKKNQLLQKLIEHYDFWTE